MAEAQTPETPVPTPEVTKPVSSPAIDLTAQYDLGDTGLDDEVVPQATPKQPDKTDSVQAAEEPIVDSPDKPEVKPEAPAMPAWLPGAALQFGITPHEIAQSTPEQLFARVSDRQREFQVRAQQTPQVETPKKPKLDLGLDDEVHEKITAAFDKLTEHYEQKFDKQQQEIGQLRAVHQSQAASAFEKEAEEFFAQNEKSYGKGHLKNLAPLSPALSNRHEVLNMAVDLMGSAAQRGRPLTTGQALKAAQAATLGITEAPKVEPKVDDKIKERQAQWQSQELHRPTNRIAKEPKGDKAALAKAKEFFNSKGYDDDGDDNVLDGLL